MTVTRVCIVGLDEPEYEEIRARFSGRAIAHAVLPPIMVKDGQLLVQREEGVQFTAVSKVVFHGIFDDDMDFIAALALWGGPCLPSAKAMMDCRLKIPCLVRAIQYSRFGKLPRGYAAPGTTYTSEEDTVAKWGNWHCGENKARFTGAWPSQNPSVIEPFVEGQAVRIVLIGEQSWQIRLEGEDWRKSIHDSRASFTEIDPELLNDTRRVRDAFGLELIANDYIVRNDGKKYLLEVNHIPNVTRFPEIWACYRDFVVDWLSRTQP